MRFAPGARLGPFEILELLGAGGMGELYRARDTRLDRNVAIKLLPTDVVSARGRSVERFRLEARAIARITHPNICTLHDVGEDDSLMYLVMEYVPGDTFARRLEDGPIPLRLSMRVAIQIADALDHAHRNGVVHRDLKPANIMLARDSAKLLDFGLARLRDRDELVPMDATQSGRLTDKDALMGTVPYMAPEQIEGGEVDARTDVFSFGVVLYEMVGGRRPFRGDSRASLMSAIVAAEPETLSSARTNIPPGLERLILRCLAKNPDDRWQTARDLSAELSWIAETATNGRAAPAPSTGKRRAALWSAVAVTALTAMGAVAWSRWRVHTVADYRPVTFRTGIVTSARFTPDGRNFVYSASWEGQPYGAFLGRLEGADARDLGLRDSRILSISRTGEMAVVFGPQNIERTFGPRVLAQIPVAGGTRRDVMTGVVDADWIPGTNALAVIRDHGTGEPWSVEFPAGKTIHRTAAAWSLRVSPDGSRVAFFEGPIVFGSAPQAAVTVIDRSGQKSTLTRDWIGYGLAWASSGNEIWFTATRPDQFAPHLRAVSLAGVERVVHRAPDWLVLHDIADDGRVLLSRNSIRIGLACKSGEDAQERDLTWMVSSGAKDLSSDGQTVLFEDELFMAATGEPRILRRSVDGSPAVPVGEGYGAALSPDGRWVLALSGGRLVLWPTGPGDMVPLPKGNVVRIIDGGWLRDSRHIVFTGETADGTSRGHVQEIPAGLPRPIAPDHVILAGKAAARDEDSVLARVGNEWILLPIRGGNGERLPALTARDMPVQWSPDGRYVYTIDSVDGARSPAVDVNRVELTTGRRALWKTLTPSNPVGVEDMRETVVIASDGLSYCYSYLRRLGDLFVVDGLK